MRRWLGVGVLGLLGCGGERSWFGEPFETAIPFEKGQAMGQVRVSLFFGADVLPPSDEVVSDALRVGVPRESGPPGVGRIGYAFVQDGALVPPARLTEPSAGGLNLLDLTATCARQAPCEQQAIVIVERPDATAAETLTLDGDYILTARTTYLGTRPDPSELTLEAETLAREDFVTP